MGDKNISPVGWYVGSYLIRFTEIGDGDKNNPEKKFLSWENTLLVEAKNLKEAYSKVEVIGREDEDPYKGGIDGVPVQWVYEGITELLPIYEEIKDGAEIMWGEHNPRKLKNIKARCKVEADFMQ